LPLHAPLRSYPRAHHAESEVARTLPRQGRKRPSSAFGTFSPLAGRRKRQLWPRSRGEGKSSILLSAIGCTLVPFSPASGVRAFPFSPLAGRRKNSSDPVHGEKGNLPFFFRNRVHN